MSDSVRLVDLYKTPSEEIRKNRIKFHHLRRNSRESSANWLSRVQKAIDRCKYPSFMIEFMLIDRFICGLIQTETSTIQLASTWSLQQIAEYFVEQPQVHYDDETGPEHLEAGVDAEFTYGENPFIEEDARRQNAEEILSLSNMGTQSDIKMFENKFEVLEEEEEPEVNHDLSIDVTNIKCEFDDYEYPANETMIYEIIDDAKISTISFQSNGNNGDETMDSTQSSDMESFDCMQCDEFIAMNQKSLDAHLRSAHNEVIVHKCPHCFTEFPEYDDLLEHFNIHIGLKRYKCRLCSKWFLYQNELPRHINRVHNEKHRITCLDCGKTLPNNKIFLAHYQDNHMPNNGEFNCSACNKTFTEAHKFTIHLQGVHQKTYVHSCKQCGKVFDTSYRLKNHLLTPHIHEKPYKCDRCNTSFKTVNSMRKHKKDSH